MLWPWEFRSGLFLPDPARRSFPTARSLSRLRVAGQGERSRSRVLFKLAGTGTKVNFGLAVQVWLLTTVLLTLFRV